MLYLIDPATLVTAKCFPVICTFKCHGVVQPMYGIPPV